MKKSIAFIGAGNMGGAMASRVLDAKNRTVVVFDPDKTKCAAFAEKGAVIAESAEAACEAADYILLAVKPQIIAKVLDDLRKTDLTGKTILSIAAGVSTTLIERILGRALPIVRIMPNTAAAIGLGAIAYSVNARVDDADAADIAEMLGEMGAAYRLDEAQMNTVICANGSSPAYFYFIMDAMFRSARAQGLDCSDEALTHMIAQTLRGAADMMMESIKTGKTFEDRIREVCSPNGTTERAVRVVREEKGDEILDRAMRACTERADEMAAELERQA